MKDRYEINGDRPQGDSGAWVKLRKDRTNYPSQRVNITEIMRSKL